MKTEAIYNAIREWVGIGPDYAIQQVGFRSPLPHILLPIGICLALLFAGYLYSRESRLSRGHQALLTCLRGLVYTILLLILFVPTATFTRNQVIRRNLLVLVDRSESMSIADARKKPEDLVDAALALGKAGFVLPDRQEAVARARRAMGEDVEALKHDQYDEIRKAQAAVQRNLAVALKDAPAAEAAGDTSGFLRELRELAKQQSGLSETTQQMEKEGRLNIERSRELAGTQEKIAQSLDKLAGSLRAVPVAVPAAAQADVANATRLGLAKGLVDGANTGVLSRIAKDYNVLVFAFADRLDALGMAASETGKVTSAIEPKGKATSAAIIEDAVAQQSGQPVAGVVLLTDGAFNEGTEPQEVARRLKEQGIPLYPVGLGLKAPEDVGLRSLIVPDAIFPKDEVRARVQVFSQGFRGAKATVRVLLDDKEMAQREVELTSEPAFVELPFKVPEGRGGGVKLAVTVSEMPGEASVVNNRIERSVRIIDQKIKVLYVEGKPRWEYRYLRVVLQRDPRLDVKFLMTQGDAELPAASKDYIARYPDTSDEAFSYDLVILGDVPSWYFTRPQLERMVQLVRERGGSLLMLAGESYAPSSYVSSPLAEILPVRIAEGAENVSSNAFPVATERGRQSLALLDPSESFNAALWSAVRPLYRVPTLQGAKPAANVLLELAVGSDRSAPYPLVAWHYAGTGKAMYVGTDQLWRLRFKRGDQYHARFWGQAIQFLALSRLLGENKRVRLDVDRLELRAGERLQIHANVLNEFFEPIRAPEYTLEMDRILAETSAATNEAPRQVAVPIAVTLTAVPGSPGIYQGNCTLSQEGRYTLHAKKEDAEFASSVNLVVSAPNLEMSEPAMQEDLLRSMADLSGGRYLSVREWPSLAGSLGGQERTVTEQKSMDLWDRWPPYVLLALCLGLEWFIRRRHHLV